MIRTPAEIGEIGRWMAAAGLAELSLCCGRATLRLARPAAAPAARAAASPPPAPGAVTQRLRAGVAGRLRLGPVGEAMRWAPSGRAVQRGQLLALLEVDGLLVPLCCDADGDVLRVLAADGEIVGWGAPIFEIDMKRLSPYPEVLLDLAPSEFDTGSRS